MSSNLVALIGHLREPETVRDGEHILRALAAIAEHGYLLAAEGELSAVCDATEVALADSVALDGVTAALCDHISAFAAGGGGYFVATAHSLTVDGYMGTFHFDIGLIPENAWIAVTLDDYEFRGWLEGEGGLACFAELLRMLPVVYAQWHPLYLYDEGGILPETTRADVLALAPQWLYSINLFGPELVERMGAERVLSAPAWRVTPLDDGGVMVVPTDVYGPDTTHYIQEVAAHLGLPYDPGYFVRWLASHGYSSPKG